MLPSAANNVYMSVGKIENGLERGFVKHRLNYNIRRSLTVLVDSIIINCCKCLYFTLKIMVMNTQHTHKIAVTF